MDDGALRRLAAFLITVLATLSCLPVAFAAKEPPSGHRAPVLVGADYSGSVDLETQRLAALGVVRRLLGGNVAARFDVEMIPQEKGLDVFEVESAGNTIILRGSSGVSACRGLKWYLNTLCHCSVSWRGDNLNLPTPLPTVPAKVRETTPFKHRYVFNYCVYGYSMAWWRWPEWERMLDILALNGINLPLSLLGQEKVWQETYAKFGLKPEDLSDFFSGPAFFPWNWMGNLDGWGGPLPQSVMDAQCDLKKRILGRSRELGMKPVLPGFSGHVPQALKRKYPQLKIHELGWMGFPSTLSLDSQEKMFPEIASTFLRIQNEIYGTDHYYGIDPFNEMNPPSTDLGFIGNMGRTLFACMDAADPKGTWVLMTWFCKSPNIPENFWQVDRTRAFLDAIPNDRLLCLELHGENPEWTGWNRQNGWHGKPWVWCAIQNFGDRVDIYGGLAQIVDRYTEMQASPGKGNVAGFGIAMEGLDYNPVVFELLFDMMWGTGVTDLEKWQRDYVLKRYGKRIPSVDKAWEILYASRYRIPQYTGCSSLCSGPGLQNDAAPDMNIVRAWKLMLEAADDLKDSPAYQFDLTNLGREAMGIYAPHYSYLVKQAYEKKDLSAFQARAEELKRYIRDFDALMGSSPHFLFGRWLEDARSWGGTEKEKQLFEWGAKVQVTRWTLYPDPAGLNNYAVKEWSGFISDYGLPRWEMYLGALEKSLKENRPYSGEDYQRQAGPFEKNWPDRHSVVPANAQGDPVALSKAMWKKYGEAMWQRGDGPGRVAP